jgi:RNA polymerase sigma factor (TIGR02999 family)
MFPSDLLMNDVTRILSAIEQGDSQAAEQLWPVVYDELRRLAAQKLAHEKPGQTLQATALVHEAYLCLVASPGGEPGEGPVRWECRGHFFAAAAEAMRRILVDQARRKHSAKRGGDRQRLALDEGASLAAPDGAPKEDLLALDEALRQLAAEDPVKARLVDLRFFAGVSLEDAARMLGVSPSTAKRYWVYARSWLYGKLHGD